MSNLLSFCHKAPVEKDSRDRWVCTACDMPCDIQMEVRVAQPKPKKLPKPKVVNKPKNPICSKCGDKIYPDAIKADWGSLRVKIARCPICRKKKPLIPISEWK